MSSATADPDPTNDSDSEDTTVENPIPCGDLDLDGDVDDNDFQLFLSTFGRSLGDGSGLYIPHADFDGDNIITFVDYQMWLECYRDFVGAPTAIPSLALQGDYDADLDVDAVDYGYRWECAEGIDPAMAFPCRLHFDVDNNGVFDLTEISHLPPPRSKFYRIFARSQNRMTIPPIMSPFER